MMEEVQLLDGKHNYLFAIHNSLREPGKVTLCFWSEPGSSVGDRGMTLSVEILTIDEFNEMMEKLRSFQNIVNIPLEPSDPSES